MAEPQDLAHLPQQALADRLVADHGALGPPGRAGGEDDVRQRGGVDRRLGRLGRAGAERPVVEVDGDGVRLGPVGLARAVELEDDPGVLDDDGPAGGGPLRIEWYERASGLEHGEESDDHVGGSAERYPDDLLGCEAAPDEVMGQLCRFLGCLTVRQGPVLIDDRDGVGPGAGLLAEHLHDGRADAVGPVVVPSGQGLDPGLDTGRADGADGPVREVGQILQCQPRFGGLHAVGDGDAQPVRTDLPTRAAATAVVDPAEDIGERGAGGEVDAVGAGTRRPVGQSDGARFGDGPVAVVADAPAYIGEVGGREKNVRSGRFRHRRLSTLPRHTS
ncbi:hypothetical protein JHY03_03000 [Streptomyces sp. CA-256286]|nr:hypothetical protein JHY03_03000 [Streptomyces sp. CA-256286]